MFTNPKNEAEMTELLEYTTTSAQALGEAIAIRAWHWSLSGIVHAGKRREVEVGRGCELICRVAPVSRSWELVRRPPTSKATLQGLRLVTDAPGLFVVTCAIDGWVRAVEFVAAPPGLFKRIGPPDGLNNPFHVFRCRINDGRSLESIVNALETTPPTWGDLASPAR